MYINKEEYKFREFDIDEIKNFVNADKLFLSFLREVELREIDKEKAFTIEEITNMIPRGTAGVGN